jgi:sugar lactone lactonase YvrE
MQNNGTVFMRRIALLLVLAAAAGAGTACGDPIVVLGETPGTVRNVVGIGDSSGNRIDTLATKSRFQTLTAVAFNDDDNMTYVADRGATKNVNGITTPIGRLFSVTSSGRLVMIMDGGGCVGSVCVVEATNMIIIPGNKLLIADARDNRVVQFDIGSRTLSEVGGTGSPINAVDGAALATSNINRPAGIFRADDGTVYISEQGSGRVLKVGTDGIIHVIAGGGTGATSSAPTVATSIRMGNPGGLALADGILYIADRELNSVYAMVLSTGMLTRIIGDGVAGVSGDGGPGTGARLLSPTDVELDAAGQTLYIADTGNHRVRSYNVSTGIVNTYMGTGSTVYNGDHIAAGATTLKLPVHLATSLLGFLFVVDQGHFVVRRSTIVF